MSRAWSVKRRTPGDNRDHTRNPLLKTIVQHPRQAKARLIGEVSLGVGWRAGIARPVFGPQLDSFDEGGKMGRSDRAKRKGPFTSMLRGPFGNTGQVAVLSQTITVQRKVDKANVHSPCREARPSRPPDQGVWRLNSPARS